MKWELVLKSKNGKRKLLGKGAIPGEVSMETISKAAGEMKIPSRWNPRWWAPENLGDGKGAYEVGELKNGSELMALYLED